MEKPLQRRLLPSGVDYLISVPVAEEAMQIQALAWSQDGKTIVLATSTKVRWLDVKSGKVVRGSPGSQESSERYVTFSPNGKMLAEVSHATTHGGACVVWDAASGRQIWKDKDAGSALPSSTIAFSPDSKLLAAGLNGTIRFLDASTGKERAAVAMGQGYVEGVGFSADGRFLAAGDDDGTILVFDVAQILASKRGKPADAGKTKDSSACVRVRRRQR